MWPASKKGGGMKSVAAAAGLLFFLIGVAAPNPARAGYITAGLGLALPEDRYNEVNYGLSQWEFDESANLSLAYGGNLNAVRLEGELSYRKLDFEGRTSVPSGAQQNWGGDQTQIQIMFNGIYQIMPRWPVSPFIGAGVGFTRVSWNDVNWIIDDSDLVFTYQGLAGISVRIGENFFMEGKYYYVVPDDVSITDKLGITGKLDNQELNIVVLGIRYNF
jgi:opacity protein-like surface antigen